MIHRYAEWTRRQGRSAQCSPALALAGMIIGACIIGYVYREVVLKTVEVTAIFMAGVAASSIAIAFTVNAIRYHRARRRIVRVEAEPVPDTWTAPVTTTLTDEEAISREADWLAGGVELAFSPDGKTLKAK